MNLANNTYRIIRALLFVVCLTLCVPVSAAKNKTFSHKYKNERLEVVLNDLCDRFGYTLNMADDGVDLDKPVTANFKKVRANAVLKRVLDAEYRGKVKKGVINITLRPAKPNQYVVPAAVPSEVFESDSSVICTYEDTTFTVRCRHVTHYDTIPVIHTPGADIRHNIQLLLGGAYGTMGYSLENYVGSYAQGDFAANAQLRYIYHFTHNWGAGAGLGFSTFAGTGVLNTTIRYYNRSDTYMPDTDTDGELYGHAIRLNQWTETQRSYLVDIPIMIQYAKAVEAPGLKRGTMKIYLDLGINLGLCVSASHQLRSGNLDHMGWYKTWNLTLEHVDGHDFYSEDASVFGLDKKSIALRQPFVGVVADFGTAIPVASQVDILVGAYVEYTANNVCSRTPDMFIHGTYDGIIGSQFVTTIHPWQAGIRVGVSIHKGITRDDNPKGYDVVYTRENVCETTYTTKTRTENTPKQQL